MNSIRIKGLIIIMAFCASVFIAPIANADYLPYDISIETSFLGNSTYFNGYSGPLTALPAFTGNWQYTAIAFEAANVNITDEGYSTTFSTANLTNWGEWNDVNFDSANIYFQDKTDGPRLAFNPYSPSVNFKLFQLTGNSNTLGYLANPLILSQGTYIIGWNDNTATGQGNDEDYDDIIIAMRPAPVPEPTTMLLLGLGLMGLAGFRRKFKK